MKLIIDIPENVYEWVKNTGKFGIYRFDTAKAIKNGTPLDNNSERVEVQAYFDGEAYGWEQGRKALVDDVKTEIEEKISHYDHFQGSNTAHGLEIALEIIDKHISGYER